MSDEEYKDKLINIFLSAPEGFCEDRIRVWQERYDDLGQWLEIVKASFLKHDGKCESLIKNLNDKQLFRFSEALKDVELDISVNEAVNGI
jgi:hypothetical protein